MSQNRLFKTICPECEYPFKIESPEVNEVVCCDDCGLNMLITAVDVQKGAVQLQLTENEADDWGQ